MKRMTIAEAKRISIDKFGNLPPMGYERVVCVRREENHITYNECAGPKSFINVGEVVYYLYNKGGRFSLEKHYKQ